MRRIRFSQRYYSEISRLISGFQLNWGVTIIPRNPEIESKVCFLFNSFGHRLFEEDFPRCSSMALIIFSEVGEVGVENQSTI